MGFTIHSISLEEDTSSYLSYVEIQAKEKINRLIFQLLEYTMVPISGCRNSIRILLNVLGRRAWWRVLELLIFNKQGIDATLIDMIKSSLETQSFQLKQSEGMNLTLELQFQLGRGVHVKGELPLGQAIPVCNDEDFKKMNQLFVYDLYDALQNQMKQQVANLEKQSLQFTAEYQLRDTNLKQGQSKGPQVVCAEPMFKHMKVKAKADMVRPNMRKRRGIGAKLD